MSSRRKKQRASRSRRQLNANGSAQERPETVMDTPAPSVETPRTSKAMNDTVRASLWKLAVVPLLGGYIASFAMWQDKAGNLVTGLGLGGWGDLLFHIRAAVFFAEQGGWPHQSFFLSGQPIGYAFVADFLSGLLWKTGVTMATAFSVPTVVLVITFLSLLEFVALKMTKSMPAAVLAALLFMCFGGLSGWSILHELSPDTWTKLRDLPHGITVWREANYAVLNPFVMMLHQRAFLLGFPMLVALIYFSWRFLLTKDVRMLAFVLGGGILLALFHPFTWVSFLLIFGSWFGWLVLLRVETYSRRETVAAGVALLVTGLIGFIIVKTLQPSAGASSIAWRPGWLATEMNWIYFWFKNIGFYTVLGVIAVRYFLRSNPLLATLVLAGATPFIAANLFQFAPWDWDNTKIFAPVWIILSIAVAALLVSFWEREQLHWKVLVAAALPVLILTGSLEVLRVLSYRSRPFTISTAAELSMGAEVRTQLKKAEVMLSEPDASHPIFMYSGRPSFVAYEGWLWSQGWKGKYEQRLLDKKAIYSGTDESRGLITKNNISYVVIGPPELKAGANQQWFDENYSRLLELSNYTIYDVRQERPAAAVVNHPQ